MKSPFCEWLTKLSVLAESEGIIVEAKYYDGLEYFFYQKLTPELALNGYKNLSIRSRAINCENDHHISSWNETAKKFPEHGIEVIGFNKEWIDEDVNPDGICVCYQLNDEEWYVAKFCNYHDQWHTRLCGEKNDKYEAILNPPTHWCEKPNPPIT